MKKQALLLTLVAIFIYGCQKEAPLTPNLNIGPPVAGNPVINGGTSNQYTTERYVIATIDGTLKSLVRTGGIFNFDEPQS